MRTTLLAVLAQFLTAGIAQAECIAIDVCALFKHAGAVFVADVRAVSALRGNTGRWYQDVAFDILEPLKNTSRGMTTLRMRPSTEGHTFRAGEHVLVFTTQSADGSWSNFCTGTRQVRDDNLDLAVARALARDEDGASITGRLVSVYEGRLIWAEEQHPGVRVTLRRTSGTATSVLTRRNGVFLFDWVRPGQYEVIVDQRGYPRKRQRIVIGPGQSCVDLPVFQIPDRR